MCFWCLLLAFTNRLKDLHEIVGISLDQRRMKIDAWAIKKSCVLIKKKINRRQFPRNANFNALIASALSDAEDYTFGWGW